MLERKEHGHLSDEQIVQFALGMAGDEEARHVQGCNFCSAEAESYRRTLAHLGRWSAPERPRDYGSEVWRKLRPQVRRQMRWRKPAVWGWVAAGAVAAVVAITLQLPRPAAIQNQPVQGMESAAVPAGLLQAAVSDHVRRTDWLLSQIETESDRSTMNRRDLVSERDAIHDLIVENRLYRQTAEQEDDPKIAAMLADLETALVALKHDPQKASATDARDLRNKLIKETGLTGVGPRDVSLSDSETRGAKRIPL